LHHEHRDTAKVSFEDDENMLNSADDIEELISWMNSQSEENFG